MLSRTTLVFIVTSLIIFLISVAVCIGFFYYIQHLKSTYDESNIERAQAKALQDSFKILDETVAQREYLTSKIITSEKIIELFTLIEQLGNEQEVKIDKVPTISAISGNGTFDALTIAIQVEGKYESILRILKLLEQLPYHGVINAVQLTRTGDDLKWKASFDIKMVKFK